MLFVCNTSMNEAKLCFIVGFGPEQSAIDRSPHMIPDPVLVRVFFVMLLNSIDIENLSSIIDMHHKTLPLL